MTDAVVYAAKSSPDEGGSIARQLTDCRAMAEREGWQVAGEFHEENATAWRGDRGPQLQGALDLAASLGAVLLVQHPDRLARGDGVQARHLIELSWWAKQNGVTLRAVQDDASLGDDLFTFIMGWRNEQDSRRKSVSVKGGMRDRAAKRGKLSGGPPPYGYEWVGEGKSSHLVVVPAERTIVQRIYDRYLAGASRVAIARELNADEIPAKRGGPWSPTTIAAILTSPRYTGRVPHRGEVFPGEHERLIEDNVYERAQAIAARRASKSGRSGGVPPEGSHLFTQGLLRCGLCDGPMYAITKPTRTPGQLYEVYACGTRARQGTDACPQMPVKRHDLDAAALWEFERRHLDLEQTRQRLAHRLDADLSASGELTIESEAAVVRAEAATTRLDRDYLDGKLGAEDFNRMMATASGELAGARARAERAREHEQRLRELPESIDAESETLHALTRLRELLVGEVRNCERADLLALRQALGTVFERVVYQPEGSRWSTVGWDGGGWLELWLTDEIVKGYDDDCVPILERVPLLLQRDTEASPSVWLSQLLFAPIPIGDPEGVGARLRGA